MVFENGEKNIQAAAYNGAHQIILAHSVMPPSALLRPKQLRLRSGTGTGSRLQRSAQRTTKLVVAVSAQQTLLFCNKIQLRYFVCTYLLGRKAFRFIFRASHASFCFVFFFFAKKKKSFELVSLAVRQFRA